MTTLTIKARSRRNFALSKIATCQERSLRPTLILA